MKKTILTVCIMALSLSVIGCQAEDDGNNDLLLMILGQDKLNLTGTFVSIGGSDSSGDGTMEKPYRTIGKAITETAPGGVIHITRGTYNENLSVTGQVSLYGGYNTLWTARDTSRYKTIVYDPRSVWDGVSEDDPQGALMVDGAGITPASVIDGITFQQNKTPTETFFGAAVVILNGASPVISDCIIQGGYSLINSNGAYVNASSPTFTESTIHGGTSAGTAIMLYGGGLPTISDCTINGGEGDATTGIYIYTGVSASITGSTVSGGTSTGQATAIYDYQSTSSVITGNTINGGNAATFARAVHCNGSSPIIANNSIDGGTAATCYTVQLQSGAAPVIYNNTIYGGNASDYSSAISGTSAVTIANNTIDAGSGASTAVCINFGGGVTVTVYNNILVNTASGSRYGLQALTGASFDADNNCIYISGDSGVNVIGSNGNVGDNPNLGGADGFHLTSSSPASVYEGGTTPYVGTDKDVASRTSPYSMGAYEYDD